MTRCCFFILIFCVQPLAAVLPIVLKPLSAPVFFDDVAPRAVPRVAPLRLSEEEEAAIAQRVVGIRKELGFSGAAPFRVGLRRCAKKHVLERDELKKFLVSAAVEASDLFEPIKEDLKKAAKHLSQDIEKQPLLAKLLSSGFYREALAWSDAIRFEMMKAFEGDGRLDVHGFPLNEKYKEHRRTLLVEAGSFCRELTRLLGHVVALNADNVGASALVFLYKADDASGVVIKIPNPFACYTSHFRIKMGGCGGENHSLKRNVHRVLTSEVINRDFHKHGIVASQKRLFLRPGASAEGVINDATCIVLAERVIGDEPVGDLGFLSDEQFEQFVRIQQKTGVGDFHAKNFYVNRDPRRIILFDTEVNCAKSETWDDLYLGRLAFQHPAVFKARLCAPVHAVEQEDLLRHRLVALAMLLPSPSSVDGSAALFRESLSEYITSLCENGYILGPYKEKLEKHWGDVVFDEFLKEPDWKKKYALLKRIDASREPSCAATHKRKR